MNSGVSRNLNYTNLISDNFAPKDHQFPGLHLKHSLENIYLITILQGESCAIQCAT